MVNKTHIFVSNFSVVFVVLFFSFKCEVTNLFVR